MTCGVAIAPSDVPFWRMLLPGVRCWRGSSRCEAARARATLAGLEEAEHEPAEKELAVARHPAGQKTDRRPAQKGGRIEPAEAHAVGQRPRPDPTDGEGQAEARLEPAIILDRERQSTPDVGRLLG